MASVPLKFTPPVDPGWTTLHIFESTTKDGPYTEIQTTPSGTPNYIDRFVVTLANDANDWFAIQWSDGVGATTEMSDGVKGGTETLVGMIVERIKLRDSSINEIVAAQEAEAAISYYYGIDDPSTVDPATVSPRVLQGLTFLALAWSYTFIQATAGTVQKFTAGLVSLDSGSSSTTTKTNLTDLLKLANQLLGRNFSMIMHLEPIAVAGPYKPLILTADLSRTMVEI